MTEEPDVPPTPNPEPAEVPIEIYSEERLREFDAEEAALADLLERSIETGGPAGWIAMGKQPR